jgi:phosphatidylserine/phosphatidylglycerophosphate/cardiolipin synthase-like enzyme
MGDRPTDERPVDSVTRYQTALTLLGYAIDVDGVWGSETYGASLSLKTGLGILAPDGTLDGYVGTRTMTAMEAIFGYARFDEAAADVDLGARLGDQAILGNGIVTVPYEQGLVVSLDWATAWPVPAPLANHWFALGGPASPAGVPIGLPFSVSDTVPAQPFAEAALVGTTASEVAVVPHEVLDVLRGGVAGAPTSAQAPAVGDASVHFLQGQQGAVLWADGSSPMAVPQPIADRWTADAAGGDSPGAPVSGPFVTGSTLAFAFANAVLTLAQNGSVSRTVPGSIGLDRYRLPPDPVHHFEAAVDGSEAELLVGGKRFFEAIAADLARVGPSGFVYISSWNCQIDLACLPESLGGSLRPLRGELTRLTTPGTEVRMQLWAASPATQGLSWLGKALHPAILVVIKLLEAARLKPNMNNPVAVAAVNAMTHSFAFLDDKHARAGSHHQKLLIIHTGDELVAYVGGMEFTDDRVLPVSHGAPLFDVSVRITGPGAKLLLTTFVERWSAHPSGAAHSLRGANVPTPAPVGPVRVQVGHTYAAGFPFAAAVQTAGELVANAIATSQSYFYFEDQYFCGNSRLRNVMRERLAHGVTGIIVLAAEESVDDLPDIGTRRRAFLAPIVAEFPGKLLVFEAVGDDGTQTGERAYVHSKLMLADDEVLIIGSLNSSRRSWSHDTEVMAALVDQNGPAGGGPGSPGFAKRARMELWSHHLKPVGPTAPVPVEPLSAALAAWTAAAAGLPGLSVRPYALNATPSRPSIPGISPVVMNHLLDLYWDAFADPV